jgi:hypothetical protein
MTPVSADQDQDACPTCGRAMNPNPMATIRHTGEFSVPQFSHHEVVPPPAAAGGGAAPAPAAELPSCSWCGKAGHQVKMLLSGGPPGTSVHICDECVALCHMILSDELPDYG